MLPIIYREEEDVRPLVEICPWIDHVTDRLILNKDGSILAGFTYAGTDPDDLYEERVDTVTMQLQRALSVFDSRITAWWIVDKRRDYSYPKNGTANPTAKALDAIYAKAFKSGRHFSIQYTLFLLYTGKTGSDKFLDRIAQIQSEENKGFGSAFIQALTDSFSGYRNFARDTALLAENVQAFERVIDGFVNAAPLTFRRLKDAEFDGALASILNRASPRITDTKADFAMLDAWAPRNYIAAGPDYIQIKGNARTLYAATLAVVKWPENTTPKMLEALLQMPLEITLCQVVRFLDTQESEGEIQKAIEYYNLTKYSMLGHAISSLAGNTPQAKQDKMILLDMAQDAKNRVGVEGLSYAYMNVTVFTYGASLDELTRNISLVSQRLALARFGVVRERFGTLPSYFAMLPGQWALQTRYELVSLENVSDMAPIYTVDEGSRIHRFFSDDIYHKAVPAFAVFGNPYGGRYYFSPHVGQVGHMVVIAPTGGGKTTFVNFCMSQFQRYGSVNTFVFDRNHSCQIVTELHGGTHIDIKQGARLNPFFALKDGSADGRHWVREFILRRLSEGGFTASADDRRALDEAIDLLIKSGQEPRLSRLAVLLPKNLENELGEWLEGRPYGMFDSAVDDFSLDRWTTIEMLEILSVERLARAFMDYAFRKIVTSLDGTPTFIYLEEASFLLNNAVFREAIDDWLKTFRKKNAFVWLTIQSPESITNKEVAASILDNIFSFLLLPNDRVESHREAYIKSFGLHEHQVDLIAKLQPKRDYLLVSGGRAHIMQAHFSKDVLAYVRSEATVLNTYNHFKQSGDANWQAKYLSYVAEN